MNYLVYKGRPEEIRRLSSSQKVIWFFRNDLIINNKMIPKKKSDIKIASYSTKYVERSTYSTPGNKYE